MIIDVGSLALSVRDFIQEPSYLSAVFLIVDLVPFLPAQAIKLPAKALEAVMKARSVQRILRLGKNAGKAFELYVIGRIGAKRIPEFVKLGLKKVVPAQYDMVHGIDLLGATRHGVPVPIECGVGKVKRLGTSKVGRQMSPSWVRDRYLRFLQKLEIDGMLDDVMDQIGVSKEFRNRKLLKSLGDDDPMWQAIFNNRRVVVPEGHTVHGVSSAGLRASDILRIP